MTFFFFFAEQDQKDYQTIEKYKKEEIDKGTTVLSISKAVTSGVLPSYSCSTAVQVELALEDLQWIYKLAKQTNKQKTASSEFLYRKICTNTFWNKSVWHWMMASLRKLIFAQSCDDASPLALQYMMHINH